MSETRLVYGLLIVATLAIMWMGLNTGKLNDELREERRYSAFLREIVEHHHTGGIDGEKIVDGASAITGK